MSLEWPFRSLGYKDTSQRRCSYSSYPKYSILSCRVHSFLDWFGALGIASRGSFRRLIWQSHCIHSLIGRFDRDTNLLHPSKAGITEPPSKLATLVLRIFSTLGLTELTLHSENGRILEATNLTILNFFLVRFGPMTEKRLVQVLMATQVSVVEPM